MLENGWKPLLLILGAAAVHELGHITVLLLYGAPLKQLKIGLLGALLTADRSGISYGQELLALLAGPLVNLICAAVLIAPARSAPGLYSIIGANVALGIFNLLPIRPLDGGRVLELLVTWKFGPLTGERIAAVTGIVFAGGLGGFLIWLMQMSGGNLWLIPPAVGLLSVFIRELLGRGGS